MPGFGPKCPPSLLDGAGEPPVTMKTSFNILCVVLVVSFVGKTWPAMAQCAFGNSPNGELTFNFAESGYNTEGAAVSFTPLENISLASVSVWITGYVGTDYNGQQDMTLPGGIYSDNLVQTGPDTYLNEPGDLVVNLRTPSLNSDSTTELTYMNSSPSTIILQAKTQYWFLIYASGANTGNGGMWVGGIFRLETLFTMALNHFLAAVLLQVQKYHRFQSMQSPSLPLAQLPDYYFSCRSFRIITVNAFRFAPKEISQVTRLKENFICGRHTFCFRHYAGCFTVRSFSI